MILVVWVVCALTLLAVGFGARGAFALSLAGRLIEQEKASQLAFGAVRYAGAVLARDKIEMADSLNEEWVNNELVFKEVKIGEGRFSIQGNRVPDIYGIPAVKYGLVDEESKINLNTAPKEMLQNLLSVTTDLEEPKINAIADAVIDWRDENREREKEGAEDFDYLNLESAYEAKDGPFESVEELLLVKGVKPSIYRAISPYVTVYGSGKINLNTAGTVVFRAMGLSELGVSRILGTRFGGDATPETSDDEIYLGAASAISEMMSLVSAEDKNHLTDRVSEDLLDVKSEAFSFTVESVTEKPESVIRVDGVVGKDGKILSWFER